MTEIVMYMECLAEALAAVQSGDVEMDEIGELADYLYGVRTGDIAEPPSED